MAITIKEIAKLANVSPTSVSLVLNDKPCRISLETKEKIKAIAKAHHYKVNSIARSLVTKKSNVLGLLLPNIENTYFSNITKGISTYVQQSGYSLILTYSNESFQQDLKLIDELINRGVEGVLLILSDESFKGTRFEKIKNLLDQAQIPFVLIDRTPNGHHCNKVFIDNEQGGYMAAHYLIQQGHTRIGYLHNPHSLNGRKRILGFEKALKEAGLTVQQHHITTGDFSVESGYQAGYHYTCDAVSAVFSSNDLMGYGLIKNFRDRHIKPMQDIEIIGYDNLFFTTLFEFPFNSIDQNVSDIGLYAFNLLLYHIQNPGSPPQEICISPKFSYNKLL